MLLSLLVYIFTEGLSFRGGGCEFMEISVGGKREGGGGRGEGVINVKMIPISQHPFFFCDMRC